MPRWDFPPGSRVSITIPLAASGQDGLMQAGQSSKLDALPSGGGVTSLNSDRAPAADPTAKTGALVFKTGNLVTGNNGAGAVTFTRAAVGDIVILAQDLTPGGGTYGADRLGSFENTITVAGQIQQINPADLSADSILFLLLGTA